MNSRRTFLHRSPFIQRPPAAGSRRWLVAELDRLVSVIVRRRDRRCVTCGEVRGLQCSHFIPRRHLATRFDLRNCHAMCAECNRRHNADPQPYLDFMNGQYGPGLVAQLWETRFSMRKITDEELRRTLARYRAMA